MNKSKQIRRVPNKATNDKRRTTFTGAQSNLQTVQIYIQPRKLRKLNGGRNFGIGWKRIYIDT